MCLTTTSYGVSVSGTVTTTTATQVIPTCGTVFGCEVEDSASSTSAASTTTQTSTRTIRKRNWPTWGSYEMTDEERKEMIADAQSALDEEFGTATATTAASTEEPESTMTEEPEITTTEEPPTITTEEPSQPTTPLEKQEIKCHDESDFPGHADIGGSFQRYFAREFGQQHVEGSDGETSDKFYPDSNPVRLFREDSDGISYEYTATWVSGCVTETEYQSFRYPLGEDSEVTAVSLVQDNFSKCEFLSGP